jgi:hypothetical protein
VLDPADNVATALAPLAAGETLAAEVAEVTLAADIPQGHKLALRPIEPGKPVVKYGQPIGLAIAPIAPGEHVHVHNCASARAGGTERDEGRGARDGRSAERRPRPSGP